MSEGNVSETEYLNNLKMGSLFGNLKAELSNTAFVIREVKIYRKVLLCMPIILAFRMLKEGDWILASLDFI